MLKNEIKRKAIIILLFTVLIISSCGRGRKSFAKRKNVSASPVIVERIERQDVEEFIKIIGKLEGITDIILSSQVSGQIVKINKNLGDWVNAGESIGSIDSEQYKNNLSQAEASLLAAESTFETASMNLKSSKKLYAEKSISKNEYLQAKANIKNAKAQLEAAKANLKRSQLTLENSIFTAPVSGYITQLNIEKGEMIAAGQPICSLVNSRKLIIKTGVGESDITKVRKGDWVQLTVQNLERQCKGRITGVGIKPSAQTANYPVEIELDNPKGDLYPGMVVKGYILSKTFKEVIYTSINNVKERYDDRFVYIVSKDNVAQEKLVDLGKKVGQGVIVKNGLNVGDLLVVEGIEGLRDGSPVNIKDKL